MQKANERRLSMRTTLRNSAFVLTLIGGAALVSAPASANSIHNEGNFGGTWSSIGPSDYSDRFYAGRAAPLYEGPHVYVGGPGYAEGPPAYSGVSPYYGYTYGPGIGSSYRID
jgi:uncharacterized membrane protein